jgi:uncharacterized protein (TIGR02145 family)
MAIAAILCLAVSVWCCAGCGSPGLTELTGPYLGQEPPGMTPKRFAPQVISTNVHCSPVFSPDGQEVYWVVMAGGSYCADFLCSRVLADGRWTRPETASFAQRNQDDSPAFSPDGNRMYFLRRGSMCYIERAAGGWSAPVMLPDAVNSLHPLRQSSVAADGSLYFAAAAPGDSSSDIYLAELVDGRFATAQKVEEVSSDLLEHSPYIAKDGSYLLFSRGTPSDFDLYVSFRQEDGSWGPGIRFVAPINNPGEDDDCPRVTDDGKYLFFVSTRGGGMHPYWVDAGIIEELRRSNTATTTESTVTDIDGNIYRTVRIGNQVWMAENLKTTRYRNGEAIMHITDNNAWFNLTTGAYCSYNNDQNNVATYGRLYNAYAVSDSRGLAPAGWHVASDAEWRELINYLGGPNLAGGKLKESGTSHWGSPNTGATNESGFTALPGGYRNPDGPSHHIGNVGFWWTTTVDNTETNKAWRLTMEYFNTTVNRDKYYLMGGFSVRCVKD